MSPRGNVQVQDLVEGQPHVPTGWHASITTGGIVVISGPAPFFRAVPRRQLRLARLPPVDAFRCEPRVGLDCAHPDPPHGRCAAGSGCWVPSNRAARVLYRTRRRRGLMPRAPDPRSVQACESRHGRVDRMISATSS